MPQSPSSPPGFPPSRWDPLVIAFVGAICIIFIILSYHEILRRHFCAFQVSTLSGNLGHRPRRLNEANSDNPSQQFHSQGLDSYVARSLPIVQFKKKSTDVEMNRNNDTGCAVCLGEFEDGDWIKHLPNCSHVFHVSCIDIWFQTHSSCPLCRAHIFDLEYSCNALETLPREQILDQQERLSLYDMLRSHVILNPSGR